MMIKVAFTRLYMTLYAFVLRTIGIAERRCSYCGMRYGFVYGRNFRNGDMKPFYVSHGICKPCNAIMFPEEPVPAEVKAVDRQRVVRTYRQRVTKKNRRRRTGGWSGAVTI